MNEQVNINNRILWIYAERLKLLLRTQIIDEEAYDGILRLVRMQLESTLILPQ